MKALINALLIMLLSILGQPVYADVKAGLVALEQGRESEAIELFKASANDPRSQLSLAKIYMNSDHDEAQDWIEKALKSHTKNTDNKQLAEVYYTLGIIRGNQAKGAVFSALRLAKKSRKAFEKAIELNPSSVTYLQGLIRFHIQAPSIAGGNLSKAALLADKIKVIEPITGVFAHLDIARADDDEEKVKSLFEEALIQHGQSAQLNYQAGIFYQQQENFTKAFELFEKSSASIDSEDMIFRYASIYQIGRTAVFSQTNVQRGIDALNQYIREVPESNQLASKSWAQFRLASLLENTGKTDEANAIYTSLENTDDKNLKEQLKEATAN